MLILYSLYYITLVWVIILVILNLIILFNLFLHIIRNFILAIRSQFLKVFFVAVGPQFSYYYSYNKDI